MRRSAPMPAATAADAPPDDPPGVAPCYHGIERAAVQRVVGEPAHRERRRVGAADDDRACLAQVGHDRAVVHRDRILEGDDAVGGRAAGHVDVDLHRDRHAVQRPERVAGAHRCVRRIGRGQRRRVEDLDEGVQLAVDGSGPAQPCGNDITTGHRAVADQGGEFARRQAPQFDHSSGPLQTRSVDRAPPLVKPVSSARIRQWPWASTGHGLTVAVLSRKSRRFCRGVAGPVPASSIAGTPRPAASSIRTTPGWAFGIDPVPQTVTSTSVRAPDHGRQDRHPAPRPRGHPDPSRAPAGSRAHP